MFCKKRGIECIAEQLFASQEGNFSVTLFDIQCNDLSIYNVQNVQSSCSIFSFVESV
jgi:hypothetical protein